MRHVVSTTVSNEGVFALYKGLSGPLLTVPLINSIIFASYEFAKSMMNVTDEKDFTFGQSIKAGCFAGLVNSIVLSPIELVKCRL